PAVDTEDLDSPGVGRAQVEGAFYERCLAGAIGASQPHRRAAGDFHARAVESPARAEALDEPLGAKSGCGRGGTHAGNTIILPFRSTSFHPWPPPPSSR